MRTPRFSHSILITVLATVTTVHAQPASFTPLADLPGGTVSGRGFAVNSPGDIVVGFSNDGLDAGAMWQDTGTWSAPITLERLPSGTAANARGCSVDGLIAFGDATDSLGSRQAVKWTISDSIGTVTPLGFPPTGGFSGAVFACSADGTVACGENILQPPPGGGPPPLPITQAIRWTEDGMVDLGTLPGVTPFSGQTTRANAMSNDGNTIVGFTQEPSFISRPCRWIGTTIDDISDGQWSGQARGCSPDGQIIVGTRVDTGSSLAFIWTEGNGRIDLGTIGTVDGVTYTVSGLFDISHSACRACGVNTVGSTQLASIWEPGSGWRSVKEVLQNAGIDMTGWTLQFANSLSDDGRTITGYGVNPAGETRAWVAFIPLPAAGDVNGDGQINGLDIATFTSMLGATAPAIGVCGADLNHDGVVNAGDVGPLTALLLAP